MNRQTQPKAATAGSADSIARAIDRLSMQRPLRNKRLQQIALVLDNNRMDLAEKELSEFLAKRPDDADAINLMARVQLRLGHRRESAALLARCLALAPDFAAARYNHADLLFQLKDFDAALSELDKLMIAESGNPLFRQLKANILTAIGENDQALALLERLVAENPDRAEIWLTYGHALRTMGFREKSVAAYRKTIELRPSSGLAYWSLANLKTVPFTAADIAAMQEQMKRADLPADERIHMQFSLGKAFEDQRAYEQSFENYAKANASLRVLINYNPDNVTKVVTRSKALFTPALLKSLGSAGCMAPDPIFIVSLPRAGSTLIEQILSSHSAIEGTAELPYITAIAEKLEESEGATYPKCLETLEPSVFKTLGEEYLRKAQVHRKLGRPFFIDKMPPNFFYVGLICLILPNAKIIDARRNPAACCLSMFKHYLSRKGRPRLSELGRFYRDYVALMAHFDSVLPGRIHRVIYEDMVANPEAETRKLLDYLGLPFEESCLRFYETKRSVQSPSSEQVRRPISGEAVDHWRNFEPWLGPLIESLGSALTEYPSVPEELR
jgi:tetratricopeptide (TPR) repeat protein